MRIKFHLNGKEINLTSDDIIIKSTNFNVDKNGNITCSNASVSGKIESSNATITGGTLKLESSDLNNPNVQIHNSLGEKITIIGDRMTGYQSNGSVSWWISSSDNQGRANIQLPRNAYLDIYNDSGTPTIMLNDNGNGEIVCASLSQTSKKSEKKNFEKLQNGLNIIKDIDIYKYNLKSEDDTTKKHIGFIIGDNYNYSKEVTSNNNDGVDIYSFVAVCCKAIQEQQEQIVNQNNLIQSLIERIEKLEAK